MVQPGPKDGISGDANTLNDQLFVDSSRSRGVIAYFRGPSLATYSFRFERMGSVSILRSDTIHES